MREQGLKRREIWASVRTWIASAADALCWASLYSRRYASTRVSRRADDLAAAARAACKLDVECDAPIMSSGVLARRLRFDPRLGSDTRSCEWPRGRCDRCAGTWPSAPEAGAPAGEPGFAGSCGRRTRASTISQPVGLGCAVEAAERARSSLYACGGVSGCVLT